MIIAATAMGDAEIAGDRIILTIPSGKDSVTVSLTLHQARFSAMRLERAADALQTEARARSASVAKLPKPRKTRARAGD